MKKIALLLTLTIFVVVIQSCSNEEAKEATSEYYTYACVLGKWLAIDSDNSEHYEFFKNASYVHTQWDFSYNIEESTIFCKPDQTVVHNQGCSRCTNCLFLYHRKRTQENHSRTTTIMCV